MVTRLYVGEDAGEDGRGAAVEDEGFFGAVEGGQLLPEDVDGGVDAAGVQVAAVFVLEEVPKFVDLIDLEIAGLNDRRSYGVEVLFAVFSEFVDDVRDVHFKIKYKTKKQRKINRQ